MKRILVPTVLVIALLGSVAPVLALGTDAGTVIQNQAMATYDIGDRRILEVGCGVGLASLVLNKRLADISATDIHPGAKGNLRYNARLNKDRDIPFLRTAWEDSRDDTFGLFDLIICSDVLFEPDHAEKLADFIQVYARQKCEVVLVDAGRGLGNKFTQLMEANDYTCERIEDIDPFTEPDFFRGRIQRYTRG